MKSDMIADCTETGKLDASFKMVQWLEQWEAAKSSPRLNEGRTNLQGEISFQNEVVGDSACFLRRTARKLSE